MARQSTIRRVTRFDVDMINLDGIPLVGLSAAGVVIRCGGQEIACTELRQSHNPAYWELYDRGVYVDSLPKQGIYVRKSWLDVG